ncbi:S8 family serine peptidase [Pleionea sp. CnH1-48]|uniref:S8 family serine peptidase n=1 Tax=Pleionea sp. CnH1-48 TaxID=2954494 RepID=UPI002097D930|nr:S8 family serine peptidase [Pleionea sp. CnH1-48]MCO7226609.1 S8 family serine peptidase [Pleionea sp. CnH1-48]
MKKAFVTTLLAGAVSVALAQDTSSSNFTLQLANNPADLAAEAMANQSEKRYIAYFNGQEFQTTNKMGVSVFKAAAAKALVQKVSGNASVKLELPEQSAMAVVLTERQKAALAKYNITFEIDQPRFLAAQNTPWGFTNVQANQLTVATSTATDKKVCIIDSGYDQTNPDLPTANGTNDSGTGNWYVPGGSHGTHVAGTIGAVNNSVGIKGVLPNANADMHIIKVFNASGWGYSSSLASAVNTCVSNGAKVVNMSLGGSGSSTAERNSLQSAANQGVLLLAASGNGGNTAHSYPASYDSVIAVGATDSNEQWAEFSQYTSQVELSAPGEAILSTVGVGDGTQSYITVGGTTHGDDDVVPHNRLVPVNGSYTQSYYGGSATGTLASCTVSGSSYNCGNMTNKICITERVANQTSGTYPEKDAVQACLSAGAKAAIVYSNSARPGLQNPFLVDANTAFTLPSVSVDRTLGQSLMSKVGQTVTVQTNTGTDYAYYNGTSMATPHATAVAALVWNNNPDCTAAQVRQALRDGAKDIGTSGRDDKTGYGLVQAKATHDILDGLCGANAGNGGGNGGGGNDNALTNGTAKTGLSASSGNELHYTLEVPAGATDLNFAMSGGSGDADLYVKFGSRPTTGSYDCRPYKSGNSESCAISNVQAGTYHVVVRAYSTFSGVSLTGSFTEASGGGSGGGSTGGSASANDLSGSRGAWAHYSVDIPAGMSSATITMSGGSGDADLYVRQGSQPTSSAYDCRPYKSGNNETCTINNPAEGKLYISIYAYSTYSGVSLNAEWKP